MFSKRNAAIVGRSLKSLALSSATMAFALKAAMHGGVLPGAAAVGDGEASGIHGAACTIYVETFQNMGCCYSCTFPLSHTGPARSEGPVVGTGKAFNRNGYALQTHTDCGCGGGTYVTYGDCSSPNN